MRIAMAPSKLSQKWVTKDITWERFVEGLRTPKRTGETFAEYEQMPREERDKRKGAAGGFVGGSIEGGRRIKGAVTERCLVTLDADEGKCDWENAAKAFPHALLLYSTHSHTREHPRLRWVVPLKESVTAEEYVTLSRLVGDRLGITETLDKSTYQAERMMYFPTASEDGEYVFYTQDGDFLDGKAMLAAYKAEEETQKETVIREELTSLGDPGAKEGVVGAFCRAYPLERAIVEFLPTVYRKEQNGRYTYTSGTGTAGAVVYGNYLYSNHGTDPAGGKLCHAFDLVRIHRFGSGKDSFRRMCEFAMEDERVRSLMGSAAWESALRRNSHGEAESTIENVRLILRSDEKLTGLFGENRFSARVVLRRSPPWRSAMGGDVWTDADDAGLRWYMEEHWGIKLRGVIQDAWQLTAAENAFHPVREYLEHLTWDGTARLSTMLVRHLGAEDTEYVRTVTVKWMCAAVARIFTPGVKFDNMLVLVGQQGIGKSTLASTLSRGWFSDSLQKLEGKDAYEGLMGVWIVELAELAAAKRSETETIKNFISKREDTFRPAYARHNIVYPRQCVFYGTTNDPDFLKDKSGNRRYWPVWVTGGGNVAEELKSEVDQLWAEAVHRLREGETLWLDTEELRGLAAAQQERFTAQDDLTGDIEEYLNRPIPEKWETLTIEERRDFVQGRSSLSTVPCVRRRDSVSIMEIRMELLGEERLSIGRNDALSRRIGDIMNHLHGWKRAEVRRRCGPYGLQRSYLRRSSEQVEQVNL